MADLEDGDSVEMQGSGKDPYVLKNTGGVYSCTCPAWRNQSLGIEKRTCKHIRKLRGDEAEEARIGSAAMTPVRPKREAVAGEAGVPGAGAPPPLLLAHPWENDARLDGWWMSEKLDGVRAYWDGKTFWSRQGNEFLAPPWFVEGLPDFPMDGELWSGRKKFQRTVSIVRRTDRSKDWEEVQYVVFDAPAHTGAFEERVAHLKQYFHSKKVAWSHALEHQQCRDVDHLREELARVEGLGGEGLMLRKPGSKYEVGRSYTLLKVKTFKDDEAVVLGHSAGAGRHKGRTGALEVQLKDGTKFSVGTGLSDVERDSPPPVGTIITFRYQELSNDGVPRFPSYVGIRADPDVKAFAKVAPKANSGSATAKPRAAGAGSTKGARRFEFKADGSSKFWEVALDGESLLVRFGRIGSNGQLVKKSLGDEAAARDEADRLIREKVDKGYVEVASGTPPPERDDEEAPESEEAEVPAVPSVHRLESKDRRFWEGRLDGAALVLRAGKLGMPGQQSTREFDDEAQARVELERLVSEKKQQGFAAVRPTS